MGFRENYIKKIEIDRLVRQVRHSIGSPESGRRADLEAMEHLLDLGPFERHLERDLNLYLIDAGEPQPLIMVLDNELKIYRTTVEDVALRKSPTVKEMVSIRNAIKILNDTPVVALRKAEAVDWIREKILDTLDLSFTADDIDSLADDGRAALKNKYEEGLLEALVLFAELLGYQKAPGPFQLAHHMVWGRVDRSGRTGIAFGPMVLFNRIHQRLAMIETAVSGSDKSGLQKLQQIAKGQAEADKIGEAVFDELQKFVMQLGTRAESRTQPAAHPWDTTSDKTSER
jgi:hypothetical protein